MYEYNKTRGGLGALPPRATRRNLPPAMGWTGAFTVPGNETRFSMRHCSGSAANPMPSSSDLICGRAAEVNYLNRIGCVPVGFQGSHHCLTDAGNEGLFFCCPPVVLDRQMASGREQSTGSALPSGALLGVGMVAAVGVGLVLWDQMKQKREEKDQSVYMLASDYDW